MNFKNLSDRKLDQGRALARRLYDYKLVDLQKLKPADLQAYRSDFPLLDQAELEDLLRQVIEAKTAEQTRVGWFTLPRDLTVLIFVLVTWLVDLKAGITAAVAALILFESVWQVYYNPRLYQPLAMLSWLTYPAYALLAWVLYSRGMPWFWVGLVVIGAWGGTFLLGFLARLPMQYYLKVREDYDRKMLAEQHKKVKDQK